MTGMTQDDRPVRPALWRGWRRRCPACGEGRLFDGYLRVRAACPSCGEDLSHQRADDGPAYATILIVGHVMAPLVLWSYLTWNPDPAVLAVILCTFCVALSLFLLPRLKGMFVAIQWSRRMHGFAPSGSDA
ncbi:MAG: DUF983 domain-containing protein [Rhodobacteraceae bacterium]|nr:DUF983 domain-containing protein [Paracoccaceae bacterium]